MSIEALKKEISSLKLQLIMKDTVINHITMDNEDLTAEKNRYFLLSEGRIPAEENEALAEENGFLIDEVGVLTGENEALIEEKEVLAEENRGLRTENERLGKIIISMILDGRVPHGQTI